ncbi:MAG: hypothetical protein RLZZ422_1234 [Pseudomonadota bacterium]
MSTINTTRISPTTTMGSATTNLNSSYNVATPVATPPLASMPMQNISQQATARIGMAQTTMIARPAPYVETISTVGTDGDDTLSADATPAQLSANTGFGYHGIRGGAGNDTLVFNRRFGDYYIQNNYADTEKLDISDRMPSESYQPSRAVSEVERFQFSDITLDRTALTDPRQKLDYFRNQWENQGTNNYSLTLNRYSDNGGIGTGATVDVINGQIVNVSNPFSTQPADPTLAGFTVAELFNLAERAISEGNGAHVNFDERGIPNNIRVGNDYYSAYLQSTIVPATSGNDTVTIPTPSFPTQPVPMDNKTYWGGAGQDTAVFAGKLSEYSIQTTPDGTVMINPFNGPSVTIKDFENFRFADISLTKEQLLDPAQQLQYRRQQWQSQGLSNYSLSVSKATTLESVPYPVVDIISPESYQSAQLDVVNGQVANASSYGTNNATISPELANLTVDALFDLAQKALDRGEKVDINYDSRGIPNSVRVGNTNYSAYIQANLTAGTTGNDSFNAQFINYPTPPTSSFEQALPSRYWGDAGSDTLVVNGRLRDFMVNRTPDGNSFDIYSVDGNKTSVSAVDIERLQFSDINIDTAQYKPQLLNYYQQQWNSAPLQDYTLELSKTKGPTPNLADSFIPPESSANYEHAKIEVKNGQIVSVTTTDNMGNPTTPSAELANLTVDKLFTTAQQALSTNEKTDITYDPRKTYPQSIQIPSDSGSTFYTAYVRTPNEPDVRPFPLSTTARDNAVGTTGSLSATTAATPVAVSAPVPSVTTSSTTSTQPVSTTSPATQSSSTSNVVNTPSTSQGEGQIKIDPQIFTQLLVILIQLLKTMQANNESHNQNTSSQPHTVSNGHSRRLRN